MLDLFYTEDEMVALITSLAVVVVLLLLCHIIVKYFIKKLIQTSFRKKDSFVAAFLKDDKFTFWVLAIPYLVIIYYSITWVPGLSAKVYSFIEKSLGVSYIIVVLMILSQTLRIINELYIRKEISKSKPIKSYLQSFELIAYLLGIIGILSIVLDKSPVYLFSGLGAITAILMLVFKDTILSFVAGMQLTTNDLIRVGDWIEMPQFNADGDVLEITLHTVKVQNWDKTITVIPAHKFLENSFKNWRGMQNSGGRRIKRSIFIDISSIQFLKTEEIQHYSKFYLLKDYLEKKQQDLKEHNEKFDLSTNEIQANIRRLTNVGTFRAYITEYLRNHPGIHKNMTFLVRQLQPGAQGLPIEIYVFTNDIRWAFYEQIQADVFDHILAVMPEFGLRFYQNLSGGDLVSLRSKGDQLL